MEFNDENSSKVIDLDLVKLSKLPILDTNIKEVSKLVEAFANQLLFMGHTSMIASFPIGKYSVSVNVQMKEKDS